VTHEGTGLQNESGDSHAGRDVDIVVRYAVDSEPRGARGDFAWVALSASTGEWVKICWKQVDFRDALVPDFTAAVVDDGFV
jgi:hypothetical protein